MDDYYQRRQREVGKDLYNKFATMDAAQAEAFYKEQRETIGDRYIAALDRQYGLRKAYREYNALAADLKAGNIDLETTSLQDLINQQMQASLSSSPSEWFADGYRSVMAEIVPQMQVAEQEYRAQRLRNEADQNFFQIGVDLIEQGVEFGSDPASVNEAVRAMYGEFGPGTDLNMSNRRMDELVLDMAAWAADQGHDGVVDALLNSPRTGKNGESVPALSKVRSHADRVDTILKTAEARRNERMAEENFGFIVDLYRNAAEGLDVEGVIEANQGLVEDLLSPKQVAGLIGTAQAKREAIAKAAAEAAAEQHARNSLTLEVTALTSQVLADPSSIHSVGAVEVPLPNGKTASLTKNETVEMVLDGVRRSLGITEGFSPTENPEVAARYTQFLQQSGYVDQRLKSVMRVAPNTFGMKNLAEGNVPSVLADAVSWYEMMDANGARALASQYLDEKTQRFYDTVMLNEQTVAVGDRTQAIALAAQARMNSATLTDTQLDNPSRSEMNDYVNSLKSKMTGWFWDEEPKNSVYLERLVQKTARGYLLEGWDKEMAYERAVDVVADTHQVVNGVAINKTNVRVPSNIEDLSAFAARRFVDSGLGDAFGVEDPDDLVLIPRHQGQQTAWVLVNKETLMPVPTVSRPLGAVVEGGEEVPLLAGSFTQKQLDYLESARKQQAIENVEETRVFDLTDMGAAREQVRGLPIEALENLRKSALYQGEIKDIVDQEIARRGG
ncbi:hypothetical protein GTQ45_01995 [Pyruvatibacter mobilis]|uniref:Uncharacterized protein n=1 Tax=Pyruvatibacter mobilis TaxID=1712261 RepID=A0A845Q7D3_9HYPH|nr:hypothetical protein [Pyruvatibacter mobilis]NBG94503.1 hypothetical protein [Pyruvatibacter mobilis]